MFDGGKHAEAKQVLVEALDPYEDRSTLFYHLACAEAQLGGTDEALGHLRAAEDEHPSLADDARNDDDLKPIRDHPTFAEIAGDS